MTLHIVIIGAGPSGLLLAQSLLDRSQDYHITLYEKRSDPRILGPSKRAFVVGFTERGQQALKKYDRLWSEVKTQGIPVWKTGIYSQKSGQWQVFQRNKDPNRFNLLIDRNRLCIALLDHLEKYNPAPDRLKIVFDAPCTEINLKTHQVTIAKDGADPLTQPYDLLVGADGSRSIVRDALMDQPGFDFEQSYFDTVWKVIHIPMPKGLEPETTYFFRHQFPPSVSAYQPNQLTGAAIPEVDGSLCILMFWNQPPDRGMGNPPGIETAIDLQNKVKTEWLPGIELTEAQATEFLNQRPSSILQTRCSRYHDLEGQVVLIGDSAHAMSSYLGQGCQAAFGDVVALDRLLQEHANDLTQVLPLYSQEQVKEGQAITDLNTQLAPRASWLSTLLNVDMALRNQLSSLFPQWISPPFFSLISRTTLPYSEIARRFRPWMRLINWSNRRIISTRKSMST